MTIRVGINGLGRIGRNFLRAATEKRTIEIVAINDLADTPTLAHLLEYDSTRGRFPGKLRVQNGNLVCNGKTIKLFSERDPRQIPWQAAKADVVLESTGILNDVAYKHIEAGAKKVVISSPASQADITCIMGINQDQYDPSLHHIISNASCTSNCLAMMVAVLQKLCNGIKSGLITNVHAVSRLQAMHDMGGKDLRLSRAGGNNIVPHNPGMSAAIAQAIPALQGVFQDFTLRVPVSIGSIVDLTAVVGHSVTAEDINAAIQEASYEGPLAPYLEYARAPIVSSDIISDPASCIFDPSLTQAIGNHVRVAGWHDNEWGYSNRLVDLTAYIGSKMARA